MRATLHAAGHGQLLQVRPATAGIPELSAGEPWQGALFAVTVGRDHLPLDARAEGQLAGLLRLSVTSMDGDSRLVMAELTGPGVEEATVFTGSVVLSVGNGFDEFEIPVSVSVRPAPEPDAQPSDPAEPGSSPEQGVAAPVRPASAPESQSGER